MGLLCRSVFQVRIAGQGGGDKLGGMLVGELAHQDLHITAGESGQPALSVIRVSLELMDQTNRVKASVRLETPFQKERRRAPVYHISLILPAFPAAGHHRDGHRIAGGTSSSPSAYSPAPVTIAIEPSMSVILQISP